jgi:hypothetical protein
MKLQSQAPSLGALTPCRRCVHSCPQTSCPFPTSTQNPVPATCKLQRDPPCFRFFELHHIFPKPLPQTQHRLNMHKCLPTGGSLQTAVSDAPRGKEPTATLTLGRIAG